jgi:16S rRNA (uracil1498-N3)-methyltransferase
VFSPIKKTRLDFMVEKATELGVSQLQPVMTAHTDVGRINQDRLRANTIEASEQCERLSIPVIKPILGFDTLLADWPADRRLLYLDETGQGEPLANLVRQGHKDAILVGPEGGFSTPERDSLRALSCAVGVTLGPRILRAETAALAALACWQSCGGDTCATRHR